MIQREITFNNNPSVEDELMRREAFNHVESLFETHGCLTSKLILAGFTYKGERIALVNPGQGIHKPRQMRNLLSIRTVYPKSGSVHYDDQTEACAQFYAGSNSVDYSFMGTDPNARQNLHLREANRKKIPIIYFLGFSPSRYIPILPTFISDWDPQTLKVKLEFALSNQQTAIAYPEADERRYAMRIHKQRLHQASFREVLIKAYDSQCAITRLAVPQLLDAAHIVPDKDEMLGQPIVSNGLLLSKTHHAAFDQNLIGIDADYRMHVSEQLLQQNDGPMLESLKQLNGNRIILPRFRENYPDRDRLSQRFEVFKSAA